MVKEEGMITMKRSITEKVVAVVVAEAVVVKNIWAAAVVVDFCFCLF